MNRQRSEYEYDAMRGVKVLFFEHQPLATQNGDCEMYLAVAEKDGTTRVIFQRTYEPARSLPTRWIPDMWLHTMERPIDQDREQAQYLLDQGWFPNAVEALGQIRRAQ